MKKIIALLLAALMVLGMVACTNAGSTNETSQPTQNSSSNEEPTEPEVPKDVPTLTYWVTGPPQADEAAVEEAINAITVPLIGAKLDLIVVDDGAYKEKMQMNMASGLDFDLCFTGFNNNLGPAVEQGALMPLDELMEQYAPDLYASVDPSVWQSCAIDGQIYSVPNQQSFCTAYSLMIQTSLLEKYDFDVSNVKTMEDIEPFLQLIVENEPDLFPYRIDEGIGPWQYISGYDSISNGWVMPRRSTNAEDLYNFYFADWWWEGAQTIREWAQKGYLRVDVLSVGDDSADYLAGKYAVMNTVYRPGAEEESEALLGFDVTYVVLEEPMVSRSKTQATSTAIGVNCKYPELAIKMIELFNCNQEVYTLLCYGIEGTHFNVVDGAFAEPIEGAGYWPNRNWVWGNTFKSQYLPVGNSLDMLAQTEQMNADAYKSEMMGFVFDDTNVKTQKANVSAVWSEYKQIVNYGLKDIAEYKEEMQQRLIDAGINDIRDEIVKQLAAYFESLK